VDIPQPRDLQLHLNPRKPGILLADEPVSAKELVMNPGAHRVQ